MEKFQPLVTLHVVFPTQKISFLKNVEVLHRGNESVREIDGRMSCRAAAVTKAANTTVGIGSST